MRQTLLVRCFQQARTELAMNLNGASDNLARKRILLHVFLCAPCVLGGESSCFDVIEPPATIVGKMPRATYHRQRQPGSLDSVLGVASGHFAVLQPLIKSIRRGSGGTDQLMLLSRAGGQLSPLIQWCILFPATRVFCSIRRCALIERPFGFHV